MAPAAAGPAAMPAAERERVDDWLDQRVDRATAERLLVSAGVIGAYCLRGSSQQTSLAVKSSSSKDEQAVNLPPPTGTFGEVIVS